MKYVDMGSGAMIHISGFIKTGSAIPKVDNADGTQTAL
jgi:hypothetical protein